MQIGGISPAIQGQLGTTTRGLDGTQRPVGEVGNAAPQDSSQVSGKTGSSTAVRAPDEELTEVAAPRTETALQTKVVTSADEVLGTGLGSNIDTTA